MRAGRRFLVAVILAALPATGPSLAADEDYVPPRAELPLTLSGDCDEHVVPAFVASGWMGSVRQIEIDQCWGIYPHSGESCIKISYIGARDWGGIVWSDPPNDWGSQPGGWDLSDATNLSFWARGDRGGEQVEFKMGILQRKEYPDSASGSSGKVKLTRGWKKYNISLAGKDLRCIKTGFAWIARGRDKPVTFYLDDIQYE